MSLRITVSGTGTAARITVQGEMDFASAYEVREAINNLLNRSAPATITLDLWLVNFIDSTGVGALVACHQRAAVGGAKLTIERTSDLVHRQLWISGLLGLFGFPQPGGAATHPS